MKILTPQTAPEEWNIFIDALELIIDSTGCDCTHSLTRELLKDCFVDFDAEETIAFLEDKGGYCPCEILSNVENQLRAEAA